MARRRSPLHYLLLAAVVGFVAFDYTVMQGERIYETDVSVVAGKLKKKPIDRVDEKHTLLLRTGGDIPLEWRLVDPKGAEVMSRRDFQTKKGIRRYSFSPVIPGNYMLTVTYRSGGGSAGSRVQITMLVNDRRTVSGWLDLW